MKRLFVGVISFLILLIGFFFLLPYHTQFLTGPLQKKLDEFVSKQIQYSVTVGNIRFLFFNRAILEDITLRKATRDVTRKADCYIERVVVSFNIFSLISNRRNPLKAVTKIRVSNFSCRLSEPLIVPQQGPSVSLPDIYWDNGTVLFLKDYVTGSQKTFFKIHAFEGSMRQTDQGNAIEMSGLIPDIGSLKVTGTLETTGVWEARLYGQIFHLSSAQIVSLLDIPDDVLPVIGGVELGTVVFDGKSELEIEGKGSLKNRRRISWNVRMTVSSSTITGTYFKEPWRCDARGVFSFNNNECTVTSGVFDLPHGTRLKLNGILADPFSGQALDMKFEIEQLNILDMPGIARYKIVDPLDITGVAFGTIGGTVSKPIFIMEIKDATWGYAGLIHGDISFQVKYKDTNWRLTNILIATASGTVRGEAHGMPGNWFATATINSVDGEKFFLPLTGTMVKGVIDGTLTLKWNPESFTLTGNGTLYHAHILGQQFDELSCRLHVVNSRMTIEAYSPSRSFTFYCDARKELLRITLPQLVISSPDLSVDASGTVYDEKGLMDMKLLIADVPVGHIPLEIGILRRLKGRLEFNGSLKGKWNEPLLIGRLGISEKEDEYFNAEISADRKEVRLLDITFLERLKGSVTWHIPSGEIDLTLMEEGLDVGVLKEFFALPVTFQGKASGKQVFSRRKKVPSKEVEGSGIFETMKQRLQTLIKPKPASQQTYAWEGEGHITIDNGQVHGVQFETCAIDVMLDKSRFELVELLMTQAKGSFRIKGDVLFDPVHDNINFKADVKQWSWNNLFFDGELSLRGEYRTADDIVMTVYSPSCWFNGQHVGELNGNVSLQNNVLHAEKWSLGKFLSGNLLIDYAPKVPTIKGALELNLDNLEFLNELTPIEQWRDIHGSGKLLVAVNGTLNEPLIDVNVHVPDARWEELRVRINGSMHYESKQWDIPGMNIDFIDNGSVHITGEYAYKDNNFIPLFEMQLIDLDSSVIRAFTRIPEWIHGRVNGKILITGMLDEPVFSGTLRGEKTVLYKTTFDHWQGRLTLHKNKLDIHKLLFTRGDELWNITEGSYVTFTSDKQVSFLTHLEIRNIYVGKTSFFGALSVRGDWDFTESKSRELEIVLDHVWVNQHDFERAVIPLTIDNNIITFIPIEQERFKITGSVDFSAYPKLHINDVKIKDQEKTIFHISGDISKEHNDFWFKTLDIDAGLIFELIDYRELMKGKMSMYWIMSGNLDNPRIVCTIHARKGLIANIPYDRLQLHWTFRDGVLHVEKGEIYSEDVYNIVLEGNIPFFTKTQGFEEREDIPINILLTITQGDLQVLSHPFPLIKSARGSITGRLAIRGTVGSPVYTGFISVTDGQIIARDYFKSMKELNCVIKFDDTFARIEKCSARLGDGTIEVTGTAKLGFLRVQEMDIHVVTPGKKGIRIQAPFLPISSSPIFKRLTTTSRGSPRMDIRLTGAPDVPAITGTFYLDNTFFTYPPPPRIKKNIKKADNPIINFIRKTRWDIELRTGENTWYENQFVNAKVEGAIIIQGKHPDFKVKGKVESVKGSMGFLGSEFNIKNAILEIVPVKRETPVDGREWKNILYLEGNAETLVYYQDSQTASSREDTITIIMERAPIGYLKPRFVSRNDPGLSSDRALERATGYNADSIDPGERDVLLRRGIVQLLDATLTTPLARSIARQTGLIDIVRISHETLPPEERAPTSQEEGFDFIGGDVREAFLGTKYTVGKQLSSKLLLEYSMQIIGSRMKLDLRHELELSYRLRGDTYIRGIADLNQPYTGLQPERKAIIERRWRFSWPPKWWEDLQKFFREKK